MPDRDYYDVLGVARDASADVIKKAYRTQARKYHPDVNPGDKKAEAQFKEVQQAYDILSDPEKRALYNNFGNAAFEGVSAGPRSGGSEWTARQAGPGGGGYEQTFDFNDFFGSAGGGPGVAPEGEAGGGIFEELLGRMRGGRTRQQRPTGPRPGRNVEAELSVPFLTAIRGGETKIDVEREDGRRESLVVKIPPGVESGAKLRLRGQGEPGQQGGPRGDLTILVDVEPHHYFKRDGRDLSVEVPISVSEAILGAKIEVPTLDGMKSLPIPPGTSSGQKLRLRGQGVPASGNKPAGDLFLVTKVVVPKKVDESSQRLVTEFAERNPLHLREGIW